MPHLRALVKRYEGRPFSIVGVNYNDSEKTYRAGIKEHKLSWISAFQGEAESPISELFRIDGYPTVVLIDHEGKIRFLDHFGLDDALIESLVSAAEKQ